MNQSSVPKFIPKFRFCRWDIAVIVLVVLIAAGSALAIFGTVKSGISSSSHLEAVLTVSGDEVWRANLSDITSSETHKVTVSAGSLTVLAESGRVCIASSDCPDQICVHTGWLTSAGQTAVCLPFRVVLKVISVDSQGGTVTETSVLYDAISK